MASISVPIVFVSILFFAFAQDDVLLCSHSLSQENYTCAHCIQLGPRCAWCSDEDFDKTKSVSRCNTADRLERDGCIKSKIENPKTTHQIQLNEPLSDAGKFGDEILATQLRPQRISLAARPKDPVTFQLNFRQAVDYPVDLYYLMDLSLSMQDDKQKLADLGDNLARAMQAMTKNFRLGFGSFVDKKVIPFVDARPERANRPCANCVAPYGYKHHMTLNNDTRRFKYEVNASAISGNLDTPECGFDAIMQALTCAKRIGWRERSRKIIVFSTDAGFHYAGDGRIAGIVIPNDAECHMDTDGFYSMSTEQDYPSISQVHQAISASKANVIFAVTEDKIKTYERLLLALPDVSTTVAVLDDDSSNIVHLVETEYRRISGKVVMQSNVNATQGIKITFETPCLGSRWTKNNTCDNVTVADTIPFNVTIEVTECQSQRRFDVRIGPPGLDEVLTIDLSVLCDCGCTRTRPEDVNSHKCHNKGNWTCGVCVCKPPALGKECECSSTGVTSVELEAQCRPKGSSPDTPLCSGQGTCTCGRCVCYDRKNPLEKLLGPFCECANFNCMYHNRIMCNGHGECVCGKCLCEPGWTGEACECPLSQNMCIDPDDKHERICNGRGKCDCGACKCRPDENGVKLYSGSYCEVCPTCPSQCTVYKQCVMCQAFKTGTLNETQCDECEFRIKLENELPDVNQTMHCQFVDPADSCTFFFAWYEDTTTGNVTVWVRRKKECPPLVPVLAVVLAVIAGIVLIGLLLLLCWRLFAFLADRAEYAHFERERLMARWDTGENPIFNPATSTFKNPVYGGKQL